MIKCATDWYCYFRSVHITLHIQHLNQKNATIKIITSILVNCSTVMIVQQLWLMFIICIIIIIIIFTGSVAQRGLWPCSWGFVITCNDTPQSVGPSGWVISLSQRPLPDNTQLTNFHATRGIWTHDRSRLVAVDLRLRLRGHWNCLIICMTLILSWLWYSTQARTTLRTVNYTKPLSDKLKESYSLRPANLKFT
jgi:hypothetical protein